MVDIFTRELAFSLWTIEGDVHMRAHNGFCFTYHEQGCHLRGAKKGASLKKLNHLIRLNHLIYPKGSMGLIYLLRHVP